DHPLRPLGDAAKDVGAGIEVVAAGVAEHDHGGSRRDRAHPAVLEIGKGVAVVGGAEACLGHDFGHRLFRRFDSRMSLTSIRCPENANERTSSTTSCRLWISSR